MRHHKPPPRLASESENGPSPLNAILLPTALWGQNPLTELLMGALSHSPSHCAAPEVQIDVQYIFNHSLPAALVISHRPWDSAELLL